TDSRYAYMVYRWSFHQVPPLILMGSAVVGQHNGHRLGQVQQRPAANTYDSGRKLVKVAPYPFYQKIHLSRFGLFACGNKDNQVVIGQWDPCNKLASLKNVIYQKNKWGIGILFLG